MKHLKTGLMALVLLVGVAGAFATKASENKNHGKFILFNWQTSDAMGNVVPVGSGGVYVELLTLSQAQTYYGCSGTSSYCAVTVDASHVRLVNYRYIDHN